MSKEIFTPAQNVAMSIAEPAVAYQSASVKTSLIESWNPNIPFHGTQEEWWEHFNRIEEGNFITLEEFDHKFEAWRMRYLINKLK